MKKKRDFIDRLIEYGAGFALFFIIITTLSVSMVVFFAIVALAIFLDRLN